MSMKNMKLSKEDMEYNSKPIISEAPRYPYGLRICLDNEAMKKLGMKLPEVGTSVMIYAKAEVVSVSANESADGGERKTCDLQITDLEIEEPSSDEDTSKKLYGE